MLLPNNIGASLNHQKEKLNTFLNQWEQAINFGRPSEPNDVFVFCDMNLDSYKDKWKSPNYPLYELSQEVLRCCNVNNMEQPIKSVTRAQYNSVTNKTYTAL